MAHTNNKFVNLVLKKLLSSSWLLWWLMLLWAPRLVPASNQQFRRTPDNQTATIGDTVTLACSVVNKAGVLQWTRDGFGLGTDRNLNGYERYHMVGSEEEGDYTLVIDKVTLEDDAVFQCQVGPGPESIKELRSANAKLTVEVPTGAPQILQGDFLQTTEDREIRLECISQGGKPAAEITWIDGSGQEIKTGVETIKELLEDRKRYNARSILKITPKKQHHNKTFTCQAHNRPAKEVMSAFIRLEVKYAPKVSVKIHSRQIREFENVKVSCQADGNPGDLVYRWFKNEDVIGGDYSTILSLYNLTRKDHDSIIRCEVSNSVGRSEASQPLEISYGPVFRSRPRSVQADLGSTVTLNCDVEGNPAPELVWFHEHTRVAVSTSSNLTVTVTHDTAGPYICQAVVQGFPEISATASIYLKGPPSLISSRFQFGSLGDTVRVECLAKSIPRPERVTWYHFGREIDPNDPEYSILEDPMPDGVKSTLVIRESQEKDFGPYNCSVTNQYGTRVMEIFLKRQGVLFAESGHLFIVIALIFVIGGVVIFVAGAVICLLCQKKPKKPDLMETDIAEKQTNKSDRSSNDSDLKVEIRTASSLSNMQEHDSEHWDDGGSGSDAIKNESLYRYSDYIDPVFPPKSDGHNNNGYVPYVDYTRDYNPPISLRNSMYTGGQPVVSSMSGLGSQMQSPPQYLNSMDLRYSATYGNPYLTRSSNNSLPHPHLINNSPTANNSHHILNNHSNLNNVPTTSSNTSPNLHTSHSNILNSYALRNGAVPQVARAPSTPSPSQYIVPSQPQLKPGTLATHV